MPPDEASQSLNHATSDQLRATTPFRALSDQASDLIYIYRLYPTRGFDYVNPAVLQVTGHTAEQHYSDPDLVYDSVYPEDRSSLISLMNNPSSTPTLLRWRRKDGSIIWTRNTVVPVYDQERLIAVAGIARDTADHKQIEQRLYAVTSQMVSNLVSLYEAINQSASPEQLTRSVAQSIKNMCNAERCLYIQVDAEMNLRCAWKDGFDHQPIDAHLEGIRKHFLRDFQKIERIVVIPDTLALPPEHEIRLRSQEGGFRSIVLCPLRYQQKLLGVLIGYYPEVRRWTQDELDQIDHFCKQGAAVIENGYLYQALEMAYRQTIIALDKAINVRDQWISEHSRRLVGWTEAIAEKMGCSKTEIEAARWAALLHDIGKMGVPDQVLNKPTRLNNDEWQLMKRHPVISAEIVGSILPLRTVAPLVRSHHERYDGLGYPDGLKGDEIPIESRIITVVDAYGAMIEKRVYRESKSEQEAVLELTRHQGDQFDPLVVRKFLEVLEAKACPA